MVTTSRHFSVANLLGSRQPSAVHHPFFVAIGSSLRLLCCEFSRSRLLHATLASGSDDTTIIVWCLGARGLPRSNPAAPPRAIAPGAVLRGHTSNVRPLHWNSEVIRSIAECIWYRGHTCVRASLNACVRAWVCDQPRLAMYCSKIQRSLSLFHVAMNPNGRLSNAGTVYRASTPWPLRQSVRESSCLAPSSC